MRTLHRHWIYWAVAALGGMAVAVALVGLLRTEGDTAGLSLEETGFDALPGWQADDPAPALSAFRLSCEKLALQEADRPLGGAPELAAVAGDFHAACAALENDPDADPRRFFETWFLPFRIRNEGEETGLITGYYEPEMSGSRVKTAKFDVPVLGRPDDLVAVELGDFRDELRGHRIAGRVENGRLTPYEDRAEITAGKIDREALAVAWLADPVTAFFLEIQGSGRVRLSDGPGDGKVIRLSYSGQNGHPYTAIGKVLIDRGEIAREDMSMDAIRTWLHEHPQEAQAVMNENASYVFFTELPVEHPELGPPGAQNVLLTPGRSLAVDRKYHALGLPMWLEIPQKSPVSPEGPMARLMVAQDTGGAIRGPVRGDFFAGTGEKAGEIAGAMKETGRLTVLLPRPLAERARAIEW